MRRCIRHKKFMSGPNSSAKLDTTGDRRVGTRVSPCRGEPFKTHNLAW